MSVVCWSVFCIAAAMAAALAGGTETRIEAGSAAIGFACFVLISISFLVWCKRHVLVLSQHEIVNHGAIRHRVMCTSQIASADWRPIKSMFHSVVLRDGGQRMVIQFRTYGSWNYLRLVQAVREAIPVAATQSGWSDDFIKPLPPPNEAHSFRRLFRFTCVASAIGWMAFTAISAWLSTMEPDLPSLPSLALKSVVACGVFPTAVALFWWLDALDKRAEERQLSSTAPAARAGGAATR